MRMREILVGLVASLFCAATAFAQAGEGQGMFGGRMMRDLNLSAEQKAQLDGLRGARQGMRAQREALQQEREQLWDMVGDKGRSDEEIRGAFKSLSDKQRALHDVRLSHMLAMRQVLTQEQLTKLSAQLKERRAKMRARMNSARGGGRGYGRATDSGSDQPS